MGDRGGAYGGLVSKRERTHLEDVGVDGRSYGYSRHRMGGRALVLSGPGDGKVASSCDHGDEPSGSIECL